MKDTMSRPGKIVCAGKNYAAHVAAMGDGPAPAAPLLFLKPATALVGDGGATWLPPGCEALHPEAELVVVIGRRAAGVAAAEALECVAGYAAGLDMTDRGLQRALKDLGHPWEAAKAFDGAAPLGPVVPAAEVEDWRRLRIELRDGDGELLQAVDPALMSTPVPALIAHASTRFTLEPGDLLFTGAPAGTAPVAAGTTLVFGIVDRTSATVTVSEERPGLVPSPRP